MLMVPHKAITPSSLQTWPYIARIVTMFATRSTRHAGYIRAKDVCPGNDQQWSIIDLVSEDLTFGATEMRKMLLAFRHFFFRLMEWNTISLLNAL